MNKETENRLLQLELSIEQTMRELSDLKTMMLELSLMINNIQTQVNSMLDKQPKGL